MGKVKKVGDSKQDRERNDVQAPDGGWGWVVVFSSLMCNILVDGIGLAYGVLLPKFAEYFQASKSKVSLVGSLMIGTYMCTGPIAGGLVNKYGCRVVTIIGSIISAFGVLVGSFSPSLDVLILCYGVIGGFGFGLMYLASIVSVGIYFDKKRPIATGIAVCGSGIGTFIFSPVLELLSEIFHWRGVLIIIAGIILNGTVCGMLIRPLQAKCSVDKNSTTGGEILISNSKFRGKVINAQNNNERVQDELYLEERQPFLVLQPPSNQESDILQSKRQTKSLNDISDHQLSISNSSTGRISKLNTDRNNLSVFHFQSLPALPFSMSNFRKRFKQQKCWGTCCNVMCDALNTLYEVFDFSLLLNASFVLLFIGTIFAAGAYYISFMYLVDSALLLGIPSTEAALLLSVIGIINIIGRILSGLVANMKNVNALLLNSIACLVAAIAVFLHPWCTIYPLLIVFCVVFGLAVAAYVCLTSIILCDLLGVERLANAFGLVGVARGIASVIAPFVAGMVFEATGNYDASFYLAGGMFFACAVFQFLIFLPCVKRQSDKHAPSEK